MRLENQITPRQWLKLRTEYPEAPQRGYWGENNEWEHWLHGCGCRLTHQQTGEVIEWDAGDINTFDLNWFSHWLQWRLKQPGDSEIIDTVRSVLPDVDIPEAPWREELSRRHRAWVNQFRLIFEPLCKQGLLITDEWQIHYTIIHRIYHYVGSRDAGEYLKHLVPRARIIQADDVRAWMHDTEQTLSPDKTVTATFIIDTDGQLWISDRHSEHVVCARGGDVLSAGEITFVVDKQRVEIIEITNQSTGYCPEPESWSAVAAALEKTDLSHPDNFTSAYLFRRCDACGATNLIKDLWFECGVCGSTLSKTWNYREN